MCQRKPQERSLAILTHLFIPLALGEPFLSPKQLREEAALYVQIWAEGPGPESGGQTRDFQVWTLINVRLALPQQRELAESAAPCPFQNVSNPSPRHLLIT